MTPLATLRATRRLLARPERWTQGAWARDACGKPCGVGNLDAASWCLLGADWKVAGVSTSLYGARRFLCRAAHVADISKWQDSPGRRHATVLRVLDRAIELARRERRHG